MTQLIRWLGVPVAFGMTLAGASAAQATTAPTPVRALTVWTDGPYCKWDCSGIPDPVTHVAFDAPTSGAAYYTIEADQLSMPNDEGASADWGPVPVSAAPTIAAPFDNFGGFSGEGGSTVVFRVRAYNAFGVSSTSRAVMAVSGDTIEPVNMVGTQWVGADASTWRIGWHAPNYSGRGFIRTYRITTANGTVVRQITLPARTPYARTEFSRSQLAGFGSTVSITPVADDGSVGRTFALAVPAL